MPLWKSYKVSTDVFVRARTLAEAKQEMVRLLNAAVEDGQHVLTFNLNSITEEEPVE